MDLIRDAYDYQTAQDAAIRSRQEGRAKLAPFPTYGDLYRMLDLHKGKLFYAIPTEPMPILVPVIKGQFLKYMRKTFAKEERSDFCVLGLNEDLETMTLGFLNIDKK